MGVAYAVGLSVMLVIGSYVESIVRFSFASREEKVSDVFKKHSLDGSQNDEVTVSGA